MRIQFNTIGRRLFLSFGILFLNIVLISVLGLVFIRTNRNLDSLTKRTETQRLTIIQLFKSDLDFLRFAPLHKNFYEKGEETEWGTPSQSHHFQNRDSIFSALLQTNKMLFSGLTHAQLVLPQHHVKIDSLLDQYNATFNMITQKLRTRGFKDFGLEGEMRSYAHQLETDATIPLTKVLTLRRYEKDFFLRKEKMYVDKLNTLVADLLKGLNKKNDPTAAILTHYKKLFNDLTILEHQIGLSPEEGLLGELNAYTIQLSKDLEAIATQSELMAAKQERKSFAIVVAIGLLSILISSVATYFTAIKLTRPIKNLSAAMSRFVLNDESLFIEPKEAAVAKEIQTLYESFVALRVTLLKQFEEINQKSLLLGNQNIELTKLNEDLDRFIYSAAHDLK